MAISALHPYWPKGVREWLWFLTPGIVAFLFPIVWLPVSVAINPPADDFPSPDNYLTEDLRPLGCWVLGMMLAFVISLAWGFTKGWRTPGSKLRRLGFGVLLSFVPAVAAILLGLPGCGIARKLDEPRASKAKHDGSMRNKSRRFP